MARNKDDANESGSRRLIGLRADLLNGRQKACSCRDPGFQYLPERVFTPAEILPRYGGSGARDRQDAPRGEFHLLQAF